MTSADIFPYTHRIVSMAYGLTKNSKAPMWRCCTADGQRVNIFQHPDPQKDNAHLFTEYLPEMTGLVPQQEITWKKHPIPVVMFKDGDWWTVSGVAPRAPDAQPDPVEVPKHDLYVAKATYWARYLWESDWPIVWDCETSGLGPDAEIVSIAGVNRHGEVLFDTLIRPEHPELLTVPDPQTGKSPADLHGITPSMVVDAPDFFVIYDQLRNSLQGHIWALYNAPFDCQLLERTCVRNNLPPLVSVGVNDVMDMFAMWHGEWTPVYRHFVSKSLSFAAEKLLIETSGAHNALADAMTTLGILEALAELAI